jgi:hypothetical protein
MEELTMANRQSTVQRPPIDASNVPDLGAPTITYEIVKFPDAELWFVGLLANGKRWQEYKPNGTILVSPSPIHLAMEMAGVLFNGKPAAMVGKPLPPHIIGDDSPSASDR